MRRTINISVSEDMHRYIVEQSRYGSVSEYIRSLVREERQRRKDGVKTHMPVVRQINDAVVIDEALEQVERLRSILSGG